MKCAGVRGWCAVVGGVLAMVASCLSHDAGASPTKPIWEVEGRLGGAWSAALPITIEQDGYDPLRLTPHWDTRAFDPPLYYGARIARWSGGSGWALDLVHHKLHLERPPVEIQRFAISHGYNLLTLQRLVQRGPWRYGAALGVVVAHPEGEVRGMSLDEHKGLANAGYYVTGPTLGAMVARWRPLGRRFFGAMEARLTQSFARMPVAGGTASVPNLALHATAALGWSTTR